MYRRFKNQLGTNIYDAMIEQNLAYVAGQHETELVLNNNQILRELGLTKEEWRRAYQFLLVKANQTEPMQYNHQFTPDSIDSFYLPCGPVGLYSKSNGFGNWFWYRKLSSDHSQRQPEGIRLFRGLK